jgi:hypothetical protein
MQTLALDEDAVENCSYENSSSEAVMSFEYRPMRVLQLNVPPITPHPEH